MVIDKRLLDDLVASANRRIVQNPVALGVLLDKPDSFQQIHRLPRLLSRNRRREPRSESIVVTIKANHPDNRTDRGIVPVRINFILVRTSQKHLLRETVSSRDFFHALLVVFTLIFVRRLAEQHHRLEIGGFAFIKLQATDNFCNARRSEALFALHHARNKILRRKSQPVRKTPQRITTVQSLRTFKIVPQISAVIIKFKNRHALRRDRTETLFRLQFFRTGFHTLKIYCKAKFW